MNNEMNVTLRIDDVQTFVKLTKALKGAGLLRSVPYNTGVNAAIFPVEVEIDMSKYIGMLKNPFVSNNTKKSIDTVLMTVVRPILEA